MIGGLYKVKLSEVNPIFVFLVGVLLGSAISLSPITPNIDQYFRVIFIDKFSKRVKRKKNELSNNSESVPLIESVSLSFDIERRVSLSCVDLNGHMNNSKYLYELNFSRRNFFTTCGIWDLLKEKNVNMIIQAQTIRYRKELMLWQYYKIRTTIRSWSEKEKCFYVESKFLTDNDFIAAIHIAKYKLVSTIKDNKNKELLSPTHILKESKLISSTYQYSDDMDNFDLDTVIGCWEQSNKISSSELNPKKILNS